MKMKYMLMLAFVAGVVTTILHGCASNKAFGEHPSGPTKAELAIFDAKTNTYLAPVISHTTNEQGQVSTATNLVPKEDYTLTPKPRTEVIKSTLSTTINAYAPGIGTIVGAALGGVLLAWGKMRSAKNAAPVLAQNVETLLELISTMPGGDKLRSQATQFLWDHQQDTSTLKTITDLIQTEVSNPDAKEAAAAIQAAVDNLSSTKKA